MKFFETFQKRGYLHQSTQAERLQELLDNSSVVFYTGFDCTAASLHVGHLMQIMNLRLLQQSGHKPIVLLGGGTTKVGDPSGRDETRTLLTDDAIAHNVASIKAILSKFIQFGTGPTDAVLVNNNDWLTGLNYIEFLRDYGKHFSINRMLSFDSVKLRLEREQNLSFLEFNYMLLQAYDFVQLHRTHGCVLQIGGSDQWGNIVNGIELNRRLGGAELYGITTPLITTSRGLKMGKSLSGAVWLDEQLLSAYDYFQFWRNCDDADTLRFLKLFTDLPLDAIEGYAQLQGQALNEAKKVLAFEATKLAHGLAAAERSRQTAEDTFEQAQLSTNLPQVSLDFGPEGQLNIQEVFQRAGLCGSKSEARRLIQGGGARVNDKVIKDASYNIGAKDILAEGFIKVASGKKNMVLVEVA